MTASRSALLGRHAVVAGVAMVLASMSPRAVSPDIVISQVYGGGGNVGTTYRNDFIELYNRGVTPIDVTGWSVQYAASAGAAWQVTPISGTIQPGRYFLVQEAQGSGGTTSLPVPDATGAISMSGTSGKVALVRTATMLSGACPTDSTIADFLGYGLAATCSETAPTANLSNTTAAIRLEDGATDTDNNSLDFAIAAPNPRNGGIVVAPPANVVISQVYGGGGNSGAPLSNDFIELRNRESVAVSVNGWTVQYASAAGTTWTTTPLTGTIPANGFYLVQQAGGANGVPLPAPDATGATAMSAASGKVALVAGPSALTGTCPLADVLDFVGYGTANCFEGTGAAPGLDNTSAAIRAGLGLTDTNDNAADFAEDAPSPKSTVGVPPAGVGRATPSSIADGAATLLTVAVAPGAFPSAGVTSVTANLAAIGGASQTLADNGTDGDAVAGDSIFSAVVTVTGAPGIRSVPVSIADAAGRPGTTSIRLAIETTPISIAAIQGNGGTSPLLGQFVTTSGIVTARRDSGFFIQSPDGAGDLDPATSDGIFVFMGSLPAGAPLVGDAVRVSANVAEFAPASGAPSLTELAGGPAWAVTASGQPLPAPIVLSASDTTPGGGNQQLERFEGMRVTTTLLVVAPTDGTTFEESATSESNGDFFAVIDGVARPVREPGLDPSDPVPAGLPCCVPRFDGNPERLRVDSNAQQGAPRLEVAAGQRIIGIAGVLDYSFGVYTILPDAGAGTIDGPQAAVPVPAANDTEFTVASFNLERFFDENDDPGTDDAVLIADAVARRLQKASLAIRTVLRMPDILAVIEVENLPILERLASRINADEVAAGRPDPRYVGYLADGNDIGGIDSGFLVKSAIVDVVSVQQVGKDATYTPPGQDPNAPLPILNDRPPLVLTALVRGPIAQPFPVTVIANHLRSLSGVAGDDGERVRAKRRAQAEFLANLIQSRQTNERIISVGDYNAFQFSDGLVDVLGTVKGQPAPADQVALASADLVTPDLTNLGDSLGAANQYSFVFDGNAQALDHIVVNSSALKRFSRVVYARLDADFPESLRSDPTRPERISDHDAIVAYFTFPGAPVVTLAGSAAVDVEAFTVFQDPGAQAHDDEGPLPVSVSGAVDVNVPGDYTLAYTATNGYLTTTVTRLVRVRDTIAPAINGFTLDPRILWPPTRRLVDVSVGYTAADASGAATCGLSVTSNERRGSQTDWVVVDPHHVRLRAEWTGLVATRVYTVTATCTDGSGNISTEQGRVFVPGLLAIPILLLSLL